MSDDLKLLVEWSSPWQEFVTAIRPAMMRSPEHLAGEAKSGLFPYRGMLLSWVAETLLLLAVIFIPSRLASMHPYLPPPPPKYDVIYFSADELPRTEDNGGAQAGRSGRAGGQEAHHRSQTIRVARGNAARETVVDAPNLRLPKSDSAVANLLAYKSIPGPAPAEGLKPSRQTPNLTQALVAPPPEVQPERLRSAPALLANVIPPAPAAPQRNLTALNLPGAHAVEIIPPAVSAPERLTNLNPKLTLPPPSIIAPPPSQVTREIASLGAGFGAGDVHRQVIPPPVQMGGVSEGNHSVSGIGNSATVVPPPVQVGGTSSNRRSAGVVGSGNVVPPPPSLLGSGALVGQGHGNRGAGFGGSGDIGSVAVSAPSSGGGSGGGTGVVVSSQPGSKPGVPGNGGAGALAMSPSGGANPGLGGSGGGSGIGHGNGPGSGLSGEGTGAANAGVGRGADANARGGISPYPGSGGAGNGTTGKPAMPGVAVSGGSNIVTLPSFGSNGNQPSSPGRSSTTADKNGPGITIVATSRSGGAFNFYGALKGDKVYTIYIETRLGTAVMQFADPTSTAHPYADDLTAPQPIRAEVPAGLPHSRLVIACVLDRSGMLKSTQVLEPGPALMTAKVLAAIANWKFRPVLRGEQPIEVNAILGFNIDTNDRF